jgi:pimeloyl-ACP methyl ester carboxylesterase
MILTISAAACSIRTTSPVPSPAPTEFPCREPGTVERVPLDSEIDIRVYLPPCYAQQPERSFPAVYLLPGYGGTNDDFFAAGLAEAADGMILGGESPPFLIVSAPDPFPDLDAVLVVEKILPFAEARYRILPDRRFRAAAGGSFGGAAAYHLAFRHPELFAAAGIFGNGAASGEEKAIKEWLAAIPEDEKPRVFINVGEGDTYMMERAKALLPILDEAGIVHTEVFSPGNHFYDYWVRNFPAFIQFTIAEKPPPAGLKPRAGRRCPAAPGKKHWKSANFRRETYHHSKQRVPERLFQRSQFLVTDWSE